MRLIEGIVFQSKVRDNAGILLRYCFASGCVMLERILDHIFAYNALDTTYQNNAFH